MKVVVTGGFGFIGSNLVRFLNGKGITPYIIERKDRIGEKWPNMRGLSFNLIDHIYDAASDVDADLRVIHMGADVDTTAPMTRELWENNVDYSIDLWKETMDREGRFIYASSGAIYGDQETDLVEQVDGMRPMNAYAFTKWQLDSSLQGKHNTYGLRFMNVYGSNENHKGNMKSLVSRALDIKNGVFEIFKTGRTDIKDGDQARDFVHVDDVCSTIYHFITTEDTKGGLFNVGSGVATSFNEIADILGLEKRYVDIPESVKGQYQYYTKADLTKLRAHGYTKPFLSVREGIARMRELKSVP